MDKERIHGDKDLIRATLMAEENKRKINMKSKKQLKNKKMDPQEAPDSIANKKESTNYKPDYVFLRRNTKNVEIPNIVVPDLKLKGIAEFNEFNLPTGDIDDFYGTPDKIVPEDVVLKNDNNLNNYFNDDVNQFVDPIEFVRNFNRQKSTKLEKQGSNNNSDYNSNNVNKSK